VTPTRGKHGGVPNGGVPRHPGGGAQAAAADVEACAEGADGDAAGDSPRTIAAAVGEEVVPADVDGDGGDGDGNGDEDGDDDTPRRFVLMSQTLDYRLRPVGLSHLSPYEMYEKYEKRRISTPARAAASTGNLWGGSKEVGVDDDADVDGRGPVSCRTARRFLHDHPQRETHELVRCDPPRLPRVVGPRLPDRDVLANNEEAQELYGAFALIVFTPWRSRDDLRSHADASW